MAWADLSDCRCCYELLGDGPPLILIPGLASTSHMWDAVAPDLAQYFSVILFDNRGIGRSVARRKATSLCDLVSDIVELLDHLQLDRTHVLGISLGGVIAQRLAIDHPSRVDRLVLVSCADAFSPYLRQITMLLAQSLRHFPREKFVRMMELLGTAPEFLDANAELMEQRIKSKCKSRISARAVANQLRCLANSEVDPQNYRISAPTLVMAGEYDPIIPGCYAKKMADKITSSAFEMIPGAGHNPIVDHPDLALPAIIEFLRDEEMTETDTDTMDSEVAYLGGLELSMEGSKRGDRA